MSDNTVKILLNSTKNINAVNVDTFQKLNLTNKISKLTEYNIRNVLSATEIYEAEREANEIYRIYGKIEWLSILNGLKDNYETLDDFFTLTLINNKTLLNSFEFYLVKPSQTITPVGRSDENLFVRYYDVIATPKDFEIFPAGFSNNVYGERSYSFIFNKDFDVSQYLDAFGFPLTDLYLYARYIRKSNGYNRLERVQYTYYRTSSGDANKYDLPNYGSNINDVIYGDLIKYDKVNYSQETIAQQTHYITTYYTSNARTLVWKYNPLIPFKLRYLSNELYTANINSSSYEEIQSIPYYATQLDDNGNYTWREILLQGYVDPLTGIGVDYPFINKKRYLFSNIILDVIPDLTDQNTRTVFDKIWFTQNSEIINKTPIGNLDNIGKPCQ